MTIGKYNASIVSLLLLSKLAMGLTPTQVITTLATQANRQVHYHQTRYLSFADKPIVTQGILSYQRPDTIVQVQEKPRKIAYVAKGNHFSVVENDQLKQQIDINDYPLLQASIGTLRDLFKGDVKTLKATYVWMVSGNKHAWTMTLTPKTALHKQIVRLVLTGKNDQLTQISILQHNGDKIIMVIDA